MIGMTVAVFLAFIFSAFTAYRSLNLSPGEEVVTSGGITVAKPTNNIKDARLNDKGFLVVEYEDGTTREVGYIIGPRGESGSSVAPTEAQIAAAVLDYCTTNGRCNPRSPSAEQVAIAVSDYCSTRNACAGPTGATGNTGSQGQNATSEQVMLAVQNYCADGRCTGPSGPAGIAGTNGTNGQDPVLSCVIREVNGIDRQYVAWRYSSEPNSAYKDLYILPVWAQGSDCVDLTA